MESIREIIDKLVKDRKVSTREPHSMSWGDHTQCRRGFQHIFCELDTTFDHYQHLPEYDEVVDWMTNTKDQGLLLMGDCGRGKSIIATGVVPVLLQMKKHYSMVVHSQDMNRPHPEAQIYYYGQRPDTYLDKLLKVWYPIVDELGVENQLNDYGERCEGFNLLINAVERYHRTIFITTNLTENELLARYGERTLDRLSHLCRIVKFKGESLR